MRCTMVRLLLPYMIVHRPSGEQHIPVPTHQKQHPLIKPSTVAVECEVQDSLVLEVESKESHLPEVAACRPLAGRTRWHRGARSETSPKKPSYILH